MYRGVFHGFLATVSLSILPQIESHNVILHSFNTDLDDFLNSKFIPSFTNGVHDEVLYAQYDAYCKSCNKINMPKRYFMEKFSLGKRYTTHALNGKRYIAVKPKDFEEASAGLWKAVRLIVCSLFVIFCYCSMRIVHIGCTRAQTALKNSSRINREKTITAGGRKQE